MANERYPRDTQPGGYYNRQDTGYGQDYGSSRDSSGSGARDYRPDDYGDGQGGNRQRSDRQGGGGDRGGWDYRSGGEPMREQGYRGGYGADGGRFGNGRYDDGGRYGAGDDRQRPDAHRGSQPQGYGNDERGFMHRAGDEVRSWFGDAEAERRREMDSRMDEANRAGRGHDDHYHSWRSSQIEALDRDYDEYRREHRSKFENEFSSWRTNRQTQRDALTRAAEHMDVVGSDGAHVGTVDKVRGDRIVLTRNDPDADGRHHSIPSSWIVTVDDRVTLSKSADDAKRAWQDEDRQAMFGDDDRGRGSDADGGRGRSLNRSFPGTY